jgi:hypothetical protein
MACGAFRSAWYYCQRSYLMALATIRLANCSYRLVEGSCPSLTGFPTCQWARAHCRCQSTKAALLKTAACSAHTEQRGRPRTLGQGLLSAAVQRRLTRKSKLSPVAAGAPRSPASHATTAGISRRHINRRRLPGFLIDAERSADAYAHRRIAGVRA